MGSRGIRRPKLDMFGRSATAPAKRASPRTPQRRGSWERPVPRWLTPWLLPLGAALIIIVMVVLPTVAAVPAGIGLVGVVGWAYYIATRARSSG